MNNLRTNEHQYGVDIANCHKLPIEEERALLELARKGDVQAKDRLICSMLQQVWSFACRYRDLCRDESPACNALDFAAVGNLILVAKFDESLAKKNPCGYLLSTAYGAIKMYRQRFRSVIITPSTLSVHVPFVESLDAAKYRTDDEDDPNQASLLETLIQPAQSSHADHSDATNDYAYLYHALDTLTAKSRLLLYRIYGLRGYGEEKPVEIVGQSASTRAYKSMMSRKSIIIGKLRKKMT